MATLIDVARVVHPCPHCGGTEFRGFAAYDEDEELLDVVSVYCARCEHHCEDTTPEEAELYWGLPRR